METGAKEWEVWLSDNKEGNFRFEVWKDYKANRTAPRPTHYEAIKAHLIKAWGARIAYGMEADDAMGIAQYPKVAGTADSNVNVFKKTVICSIDKDLLQVSGQHYNFVKKEWYFISEWEGLQWFYKQILIGDRSDNVRGCKGIGTVKAGKAIDPIGRAAGEEALFQKVLNTYIQQEGKEKSKKEILEHILTVGRLLKIKQEQEESLWHFPTSYQTMDTPVSSFTQPKQEPSIQSTAPIGQAMTLDGSSTLGCKTDVTSTANNPA